MRRFRVSILWLAAIFVITGAALGSAKVGDKHRDEPSATESPLSAEADEDAAKVDSDGDQGDQSADGSGERKQNHGFFVSQAAHCENVDDPHTPASPDFTAPEDCAGSAHGQYVSSVAKSPIGKKDKKKTSDSDGS